MQYSELPSEHLFQFEITLNSSLEKVWNYVSDTERANQSVGEPKIEYNDIPRKVGGSTKEAIQLNTGFLLKFEERPAEWVEGKFFQIVREYFTGPIKRLVYRVELKEENGKVKLKNIFRTTVRWKLFTPINILKFNIDVIPRYKNYHLNVDNIKENSYTLGITELQKKIKPEELNTLSKKLSKVSKNVNLCELIASHILKSQDLDLLKIRPYRLAEIWNVNKKEVLELFLRGTKEGFFDLNWDVICPSCRGAKSSSNSLLDMKQEVHCSSCNIDYNADFDKSVELTFTPNASVRQVIGGIYCASGPRSTPHLKAQIRVAPEATEKFEYCLLPGIYKIYSQQSNAELELTVEANAEEINTVLYGWANGEKKTMKIAPGIKLFEFRNVYTKEEITVKLEHSDWLENIVTASEVTAMHEFRELFSSEVLRPGEEIGIKNLAILFTDLKGSTEFYNTKGDAFAYKAVSSHFEILIQNISKYEGAIVKTIGDAIMAIFYLPVNAVLYAIQVQKDITDLNEKEYGKKVIVLKVGIHAGSVLAVNQNEKLDYFGKTVNLAARVEGKCKGGDIVITRTLYENEAVKSLIQKEKIQIEIFESNLKGFEESSELVRLIL